MRQNFKVEMKNRTNFSEKNTEEMLEMFYHISFLWMPKRHPILKIDWHCIKYLIRFTRMAMTLPSVQVRLQNQLTKYSNINSKLKQVNVFVGILFNMLSGKCQ